MSAKSKKLCIKLNEFQQNISSSFKELREDADFSDVTLVCEEDQQFEAHRVILSACSPLFQNMLKKNKHSHPLIYMRGLKAKDLLSILDFMYHGEAFIYKDDLDAFLTLAEELQLKGLAGVEHEEESLYDFTNVKENGSSKSEGSLKSLVPVKVETSTITDDSTYSFEISQDKKLIEYEMSNISSYQTETVSKPKDTNAEKINSLMRKFEGKWICKVCGKTGNQKGNMNQHIEANHTDGGTYTCNLCGKTSRTKHALQAHGYLHHKSK